MSELTLSLAIHESLHTRDVLEGRVKAQGIKIIPSCMGIESILVRFGANLEFDMAEFSFANYCAQFSASSLPKLIALPIFTSRAFRQSAIYVLRTSRLRKPDDLRGCAIGIPQWSQTASVYVRGYLAHHAGVPLSSIKWVQAGLDQAGRKDNILPRLPDGVSVMERPEDNLNDLLLSGAIDAIISAKPPKAFVGEDKRARRLFSNCRAVETQYFRETGIFPIMHLLVLRREVYESNRWIARNLFEAFETAKQNAVRSLRNAQTSYLPAAWAADDFAESSEILFAGGEPWPYGLASNAKSIEALLQYCFEQGLTLRKLEMDEIFAPESMSIARI